jgi:hypothetical protein
MSKDKKVVWLSDYLEESNEIFSRYGVKSLVVSEGRVFFGKYPVHPDFVYLIRVPFEFFVSVTFESESARKSASEQIRRERISVFLDYLNERVLQRHPSIVSGKKTVRAVWSVEYGDLNDDKDSAHCHLLVYLDERVADAVRFEVLADIKGLNAKSLSAFDFATLDVGSIRGAQTRAVRYVSKIEYGREDKHFGFSKGFHRVIRKKYVPKDLPEAA